MDIYNVDLLVRLIGRLGFIFVLIGAYSLWHLPVLRKHTNQFFWLATVVCVSSLLFTLIEFYFSPSTDFILSLIFNTFSTWILAFYLNYRAYTIKQKVDATKINQFTAEVDRKIRELKHAE